MLTTKNLKEDYNLELVSCDSCYEREITKAQVSRPGLELAGLFDFYEHDRVQVFGSKEVTFFHWLSEEEQLERTEKLFAANPPAFVFSKNAVIPELFIELGKKYKIPIFKSTKKTSGLLSGLYLYLNKNLAKRDSVHGTLLDVSGVGVLLRGKSGLGKSEVALELIRRGHQLVADDRVDIYQRELGVVVGEAPDILKKYLEIRGIGVVNVVHLFGVKAYKEDKKIMLVVDLEKWDKNYGYDRLGIENYTIKFFESDIAHVTIPVSEGRNLASLVEIAAMNARLKHLGTNSAQEFADNLDKLLMEG